MYTESEVTTPSHLAPEIFWFINQAKINFLRGPKQLDIQGTKEAMLARCEDRIALCQILQDIDSENPTWVYGQEFFQTFPYGEEAIWKLLGKWGVFSGKDGELTPPKGMDNRHPAELMDLDRETVNKLVSLGNLPEKNQGKLYELAEKARLSSFNQYDLLKSGLLELGNVPFLCRAYIQTLIDADPNAPKCLIGMSIDEVKAYQKLTANKDGELAPPLVGINKNFPPLILQAIKDGFINTHDVNNQGIIKINDLDPGKIYAVQYDITQGFPIEPEEYVLAGLYVWHHIHKEDRKILLPTMVNYAKKIDGDPNRPGVLIFEPLKSRKLLSMVAKVNGPGRLGNETAGFDAILGTTICGGQTPEEFIEEAKQICPGIDWSAEEYPELPQSSFFQKNILPYQQVGLIGWKKAT